MGRLKQSADRERQDLWHMPSLLLVGGVVWDFWAKAVLVNSYHKSWVLVNPTEVFH